MLRNQGKVKFNWWTLLGKIRKIKQLIDTVVILVRHVEKACDDIVLRRLVQELDSLLDDILK